MRLTFIAAKKAEHTVTILCRCLRVTRSGFYAWQRRPESTHASDDRRLKVLVRASFEESQQRYGSPRVHEDLREQDEHVSRTRVVRLMQEDGLVARRRKRYTLTTMSDHDQPVAANILDRRFEADAAQRPAFTSGRSGLQKRLSGATRVRPATKVVRLWPRDYRPKQTEGVRPPDDVPRRSRRDRR